MRALQPTGNITTPIGLDFTPNSNRSGPSVLPSRHLTREPVGQQLYRVDGHVQLVDVVLREEGDLQVPVGVPHTRGGRQLVHQDLQQRRLTGAVLSHLAIDDDGDDDDDNLWFRARRWLKSFCLGQESMVFK